MGLDLGFAWWAPRDWIRLEYEVDLQVSSQAKCCKISTVRVARHVAYNTSKSAQQM